MKERKPYRYWTKERCIELAKTCEQLGDIKTKHGSAWAAICRHGWKEDVKAVVAHRTYWNFEQCKALAKECSSRKDFQDKHRNAYAACQRNGWLDAVCEGMERQGSFQYRKIYVFEFDDGFAYVGLAASVKRRESKHRSEKNSAVYLHIHETGASYILKELTGLLTKEEAAIQEEVFKQQYAANGWKMLNRVKCGGLGSNGRLKYTKEEIIKTAQDYKTKGEFRRDHYGMYIFAREHHFFDEVCKHMPKSARGPRKWTEEKIKEAVSLSNGRKDLYDKFPTVYNILNKENRLNEFFPKITG